MTSLIRNSSWTAKLLAAFAGGAIIAIYIAHGYNDLPWFAAPTALFNASAPKGTPKGTPASADDMANSTAVDLGWYPPSQSVINNLTNVASNGTMGVYGFIYNSSYTPDDEYGTYNWCNMPHVRSQEYVRPSEDYELAYVELIHRHHKRTPYAANSFPVESYTWDCEDEGLFYFARPFSGDGYSPNPDAGRNSSALAYWDGFSGFNPFVALASGWKGTCQFPQITSQGLDDSWQHGADLYGVYHDLLGFLPDQGDETWRQKVKYRVTNNVITSEVAGMVINAMWNTTASVPLLVQPDDADSLEPAYTCASSSDQYDEIESASNPQWEAHLEAAESLYATLDGISGVDPTDSGFHASFDHYYDNLSARQCHGKPLPCKLVNVTNADGTTTLANDTTACVTQDMADEVYRFGNWEYSQIYRDSGAESLAASVGSFGVWVAELASHLRGVIDGSSDTLWYHNVAHDGSVSRLLGILQADIMVWPGMGSEVVFEMWKGSGNSTAKTATRRQTSGSGFYVRVLFGGQVLTSSNPSLGTLDMVPVETLLAYFDGLVGINASLIVGKCDNSTSS